MTKTILTILMLAAVPFIHAAEADSQPIIIPLHDGSKPAIISIKLMNGGVTIRGEDRADISVENSGGKGNHESRPARSDGMRRLDLGLAGGLDITEENNKVSIKSMTNGSGLIIAVPRRCSVQVKAMNGGPIDVQSVSGDIDLENLNGAIHVKDASGSVIAHSLNGEVTAELNSVDPTKPMSFSTMNGKIDVTLPSTIKANVTIKTDNGEILSDFDVKLTAGKSLDAASGRQSDGTFHIRLDKTLHGTINGGGTEYQFRSYNGEIVIRQKK